MNNLTLAESLPTRAQCRHSIDALQCMPSNAVGMSHSHSLRIQRTNYLSDGKIISVWFRRRIINSVTVSEEITENNIGNPCQIRFQLLSHTLVCIFASTTATVFSQSFFFYAKFQIIKKFWIGSRRTNANVEKHSNSSTHNQKPLDNAYTV